MNQETEQVSWVYAEIVRSRKWDEVNQCPFVFLWNVMKWLKDLLLNRIDEREFIMRKSKGVSTVVMF